MIYLILNPQQKFCKIGLSISPEKRLIQLQNGNPYKLELICCIEGGINEERKIHEMFNHLRMEGEWFKYNSEIVNYFNAPETRYTEIHDNFSKITAKMKSIVSAKLLFWLLPNECSNRNEVSSGQHVYDKFIKYLTDEGSEGIAMRTFKSAFEELTSIGALTRVGRGHYYLNPYVFWRDDKKERINFIMDENKEKKFLSHNPIKQVQ